MTMTTTKHHKDTLQRKLCWETFGKTDQQAVNKAWQCDKHKLSPLTRDARCIYWSNTSKVRASLAPFHVEMSLIAGHVIKPEGDNRPRSTNCMIRCPASFMLPCNASLLLNFLHKFTLGTKLRLNILQATLYAKRGLPLLK
uniref:Uncharacterized protein n=1 Tax=Opuntia streptacantha TaxID=393608 RepID=A0A7C8ZBB9_OPUST